MKSVRRQHLITWLIVAPAMILLLIAATLVRTPSLPQASSSKANSAVHDAPGPHPVEALR